MLQDMVRSVEQSAGYLLVNGQAADPSSLAELYREFAVFCISQDINRSSPTRPRRKPGSARISASPS
jgi:hypothetical protein